MHFSCPRIGGELCVTIWELSSESVVMISHNLEALEIADRRLHLADGRLLEAQEKI